MPDAPKLTRWFGGTVRPARPGVYESMYAGVFRLFDGSLWHKAALSPRAALGMRISSRQQERWRGLAQPPAEALADAWDHLLTVGEG